MIPEQELSAEALNLVRVYGVQVSSFIEERITLLASHGEVKGVRQLRNIAGRLENMMAAESP